MGKTKEKACTAHVYHTHFLAASHLYVPPYFRTTTCDMSIYFVPAGVTTQAVNPPQENTFLEHGSRHFCIPPFGTGKNKDRKEEQTGTGDSMKQKQFREQDKTLCVNIKRGQTWHGHAHSTFTALPSLHLPHAFSSPPLCHPITAGTHALSAVYASL